MCELRCGDQIFHNGLPVELLYRLPRPEGETWRVRPLFVIAEDRVESFGPYDSVSFVHTRKGRAEAGGESCSGTTTQRTSSTPSARYAG